MGTLMTTYEVAKLLGICPGTLKLWRRIGKGPKVVRLGRTVRHSMLDIEAFIRSHTEARQ